MMPSPENIRIVIATLEKRIEHKEAQATAINTEAECRAHLVHLQKCATQDRGLQRTYADQHDAIQQETKARCALIALDIEQMQVEKAQAERVLQMITSNLIVPVRQ